MSSEASSVNTMTPQEPRGGPLTVRQTAISAGLGVILWFAGAMLVTTVRNLGWMDGGLFTVLVFITGAISCWFGVPVIGKIAGLVPGQLTNAIAVGTVAALCLDGLAITWAQGLYGGPGAGLAEGAAFIMWGGAWFLLSALWMDRRG